MGRYSPRFAGAGGQFLKQIVEKNLIKVILTPRLKAMIREEFDCTDEDIDKAVQMGITDFGDDFKKLLAEQRAMLTPPKEPEYNLKCPKCSQLTVKRCDCPIYGPGEGADCTKCEWTHMDPPPKEIDNDEQ